MRPPGPDSSAFDTEVFDHINELEVPTKPTQFAGVLEADLPPAADWPLCGIIVTDKNCLALSTLVVATWTWLRADGSAL